MVENLGAISTNKRVTIVDLARELGVTPGTVSRALANDPRVKTQTREKIVELAQRLSYRPNLAARSLVLNQGN
jgi:LacI family transcriptional regulator